ncbi:MAG TPA: hypothetical protein VFI03_05000 [Solirubrobacterales bacterium]|nr:hypothetical protein [Solirubrobacterales bacterium]
MNPTKSSCAIALLAIFAVLAIAGCGSGGSGSGYGGGSETTSSSSEDVSTGGAAAVLSVASVPKAGPVLVDSKGFVVYDFHKDKGTTSSCYGACAEGWPPVTTEGAPSTAGGAMAAKLGTTKRKDGTTQVTYAGHPLYTFAGDSKPGEANGNDIDAFGAEWYALQGSGAEAEG